MLTEIDSNIWTYTGPNIVFAGTSMHTRMTIVRLSNGALWIHSPTTLNQNSIATIEQIGGDVAALVAPNKFHYLYIDEWRNRYPNAQVFAERMLKKKIPALDDDQLLTNTPDALYAQDIDQVVFNGNRLFEEVVFFHKQSRSLILTDLMINLDTQHMRWLPKMFLKFEGATFPNGGVPRLYRWMTTNKAHAKAAYDTIRAWQPERLLFCHGEAFATAAQAKLDQEFAYLS